MKKRRKEKKREKEEKIKRKKKERREDKKNEKKEKKRKKENDFEETSTCGLALYPVHIYRFATKPPFCAKANVTGVLSQC